MLPADAICQPALPRATHLNSPSSWTLGGLSCISAPPPPFRIFTIITGEPNSGTESAVSSGAASSYAPWCPACQRLQSEWATFAEWGEDLGVSVAKVDVTAQPGLSGRFIITALPTIYHCKDGIFRKYQGPRMHTDFISFVNEKEWEQLEAVSSWFSPDSFLMCGMSALFHLSVYIRNCHNYFLDLGIPSWGSYIIFGVFTLLFGLMLGLLLVFVSDYLCPARRHRPQPYPQSKKLSPEAIRLLKDIEEKQRKEDDSDEEHELLTDDTAKDKPRKRTVKS